jgi:hypothetical protein
MEDKMVKKRPCLFLILSIFMIVSCAPEEQIKKYETVVSFAISYGDGELINDSYVFVDSVGFTFGYLNSDKIESIGSLFPGDYLEITYTGEIYSEPVFPPNCYIRDGELKSKRKVSHNIQEFTYLIKNGVGELYSEDFFYTYNNSDYYLSLNEKRVYPLSSLEEGTILKGSYASIEDKYDDGKVIHNIACFFVE